MDYAFFNCLVFHSAVHKHLLKNDLLNHKHVLSMLLNQVNCCSCKWDIINDLYNVIVFDSLKGDRLPEKGATSQALRRVGKDGGVLELNALVSSQTL